MEMGEANPMLSFTKAKTVTDPDMETPLTHLVGEVNIRKSNKGNLGIQRNLVIELKLWYSIRNVVYLMQFIQIDEKSS